MKWRSAFIVMACLAALWLTPASGGEKFNPNQPATPTVKPPTVPAPVPPPVVKLPPPVVAPPPPEVKLPPPTVESSVAPAPAMNLPPPAVSPVIEPRVSPGTLPVDPTRGLIGDRERKAAKALLDAKAAEQLEEELGLDAVMGAGPGDDSTIGFSTIPVDRMEELCKGAAFRRNVRGLGICAGGDAGGLPPDSDFGEFYDTKRPVPGDSMSFEGKTAGSGVPRRGGQAGEDAKPTDSWIDREGRKHVVHTRSYRDGAGGLVDERITRVSDTNGDTIYIQGDFTMQDHRPGAAATDFVMRRITVTTTDLVLDEVIACQGDPGGTCVRVRQPDERGPQGKAKAWFCARNPEAAVCRPVNPQDRADPASPDGEGTPTGPRPATHRLGRESVSDPGPADSEIRGTSGGGGSKPLDIVDPIDPGGPGR